MLKLTRVREEVRNKILNSQKKSLALITLLAFLLSFSGTTQASADPYSYLNNGIISFAGSNNMSNFYNSNNNWQQAYLYTNSYDSSSKIALTNGSGWGVTLTKGDYCFSGSSCSGKTTGVTSTRSIDYTGLSSFNVSGNTYTYGTIVETDAVTLGGQAVEIVSSVSLARDSNYAVITTAIRNLGGSVSDLKLFVNNYDAMVSSDSEYRSTRGNVVDGSFVSLTDTSQSSNAVLADALQYVHNGTNYGEILLAGSNTGTLSSILYNGCCSPPAVAYSPQTQITQTNVDGQYAILNQLPTLSSGQTSTLKWAFGGASYSTLTSSAFLNALLSAVGNSTPAPAPAPAPAPVSVRQTNNLSFAQSLHASDTLSDEDGQLRATVNQIMSKYGSLIK
jgi:hypothetical protein